MKSVAARIVATAVLAPTASILLGIVNVYADEKPGNPGHHYGEINNPGHHYGQLKHLAVPPPSTQTAPPVAQTPPLPATSPHQPGQPSGRGPAADPASSATGVGTDLPAALPISNVQPGRGAVSTPLASHDGLSWLLLLILPALLAVWLLVFARALLTVARLRQRAA